MNGTRALRRRPDGSPSCGRCPRNPGRVPCPQTGAHAASCPSGGAASSCNRATRLLRAAFAGRTTSLSVHRHPADRWSPTSGLSTVAGPFGRQRDPSRAGMRATMIVAGGWRREMRATPWDPLDPGAEPAPGMRHRADFRRSVQELHGPAGPAVIWDCRPCRQVSASKLPQTRPMDLTAARSDLRAMAH